MYGVCMTVCEAYVYRILYINMNCDSTEKCRYHKQNSISGVPRSVVTRKKVLNFHRQRSRTFVRHTQTHDVVLEMIINENRNAIWHEHWTFARCTQQTGTSYLLRTVRVVHHPPAHKHTRTFILRQFWKYHVHAHTHTIRTQFFLSCVRSTPPSSSSAADTILKFNGSVIQNGIRSYGIRAPKH